MHQGIFDATGFLFSGEATLAPCHPGRCGHAPRRIMLKAGIVGLPNVGKSTLFNAVTRTRKAQAANYPF
jgi:hypothetical protein